jgi:uncharacterized protein (DUF849 family)
MTPAQRYAAVEKLLRAGLIEWAVVDPGSVNIAHAEDVAAQREGFVYANPEAHVRYGLALARAHRMTPSYAIYEPGFVRLGAALHAAAGGAPQPVYRFMFSTEFRFGFPPLEWALDAYLRLLQLEAPAAPWMVAGLGVHIEPLLDAAVGRGGHVRVGLEDAPLGCGDDNRALVARAARASSRPGAAWRAPRRCAPRPATDRAQRVGAAAAVATSHCGSNQRSASPSYGSRVTSQWRMNGA